MEEQGMILEDFYIAIKKRWIMILVLVIVPVLLVLFAPKSIVHDEYEASAKLYALRTNWEMFTDSPKGSIEYNLLNSFVQDLQSEETLEEAIKKGGSSLDVKDVLKNISVSIVKDSNVVDVTLKGNDKEQIEKVLNGILQIAPTKVEEFIPQSELTVIDSNEAVLVSIADDGGSDVKKVIFIFGAMAFLSVLIAVTLEYLDDSFKHEEQVEKTLNTPVLLSLLRKKNKNGIAYEKLSTNIICNKLELKRILVTSTTRKEEKEDVVKNLASNFELKGKSTLVIEINNKSENTKSIDLQKVTKENLNEYIIKDKYDLLSVIIGNNINNEVIKDLFAIVNDKYDYVIINGDSVNDSISSQVFAKEVDGTIFVIKAYKNKRKDVLIAMNELRGYKNNIVGVVLNNVEI